LLNTLKKHSRSWYCLTRSRLFDNAYYAIIWLQQTQSFDRLQDKPFWIWNIQEHKQEDIRTKVESNYAKIISSGFGYSILYRVFGWWWAICKDEKI